MADNGQQPPQPSTSREQKKQDSQDPEFQPIVEHSIFELQFRRIILNKGHIIHNHNSKLSHAVCSLSGLYHWVLTASPINNQINNIWPLLNFIHLQPFTINKCIWNERITRQLAFSPEKAFHNFHTHILPVTIQRTNKSLNLPPLDHQDKVLEFSEVERLFYEAMFFYCHDQVKWILENFDLIQQQWAAAKAEEECNGLTR
jgi:SNF2 family DNA or RNA helicase